MIKMEDGNMTTSVPHSTNVTMITRNISTTAVAPPVKANKLYHDMFSVYLPVVILVVGIIGNILVVIVMRNNVFKKLPLSIYFTAIAVSDSAYLLLATSLQMTRELNGFHFFRVARYCASLG